MKFRLFALLLGLPLFARAETFTVTSDDSGIGPGTFATMLAAANISTDTSVTITFSAAVTDSIGTDGATFTITRPMTISGPAGGVRFHTVTDTTIFLIQPSAVGLTTFTNVQMSGTGAVFHQGHGGPEGGLVKVDGTGSTGAVQVTFNTCDFTYSFSAGRGGGCFIGGGATASFNRCLFDSCEAFGNGGGVAVVGSTATFRTCRFQDNLTTEHGGGIFATNSTVSLFGCTLSENYAGSRSYSTPTNDDVGDGGGIRSGGSSVVTLVNTVVAGNHDMVTSVEHHDLSGDFVSSGHNFIGIRDGATGFGLPGIPPPGAGDIVGTAASPLDAMLDGRMTPLWSSPLRDAGDNAAAAGFTFDQAGNARIVNGTVDIGAMEALFTSVVTTDADSGPGSLRAALDIVSAGAMPTVVSFDPAFFSTRRTIRLLSALPILQGGFVIDASQTAGVTVDGQNLHPIFRWEDDAIAQTNELAGLHLKNGLSPGNGIAAAVSQPDVQDSVILRSCTVSGCQNGLNLGAVHAAGAMTLENCTLSGNFSATEQAGNAVNGSATLIHCTIVPPAGALSSPFAGSVKLANCLITGHAHASLPASLASASSLGGNVTDTVIPSLSGPNPADLLTTRSAAGPVGLSALALNGGPIPVHALLMDSAAIDRGKRDFSQIVVPKVELPLKDATGLSRLKGPELDAGAVEWTPIGYAAWKALVFTGPGAPVAADQAIRADPDKDGIPNAVEFYTGSNPNIPGPAPITLTKAGSTVSITYPVARGRGVQNAGLRASTDLQAWSALPASYSAPVAGAVSGVTDQWTVSGPAGALKGFFRLEVNP